MLFVGACTTEYQPVIDENWIFFTPTVDNHYINYDKAYEYNLLPCKEGIAVFHEPSSYFGSIIDPTFGSATIKSLYCYGQPGVDGITSHDLSDETIHNAGSGFAYKDELAKIQDYYFPANFFNKTNIDLIPCDPEKVLSQGIQTATAMPPNERVYYDGSRSYDGVDFSSIKAEHNSISYNQYYNTTAKLTWETEEVIAYSICKQER